MQKVTIIVEQASDGNYWCRTVQDVGGVGLNSCGTTVELAKQDLMNCYQEAKEDLEEQGKSIPAVEFVYKYDLQSFFETSAKPYPNDEIETSAKFSLLYFLNSTIFSTFPL